MLEAFGSTWINRGQWLEATEGRFVWFDQCVCVSNAMIPLPLVFECPFLSIISCVDYVVHVIPMSMRTTKVKEQQLYCSLIQLHSQWASRKSVCTCSFIYSYYIVNEHSAMNTCANKMLVVAAKMLFDEHPPVVITSWDQWLSLTSMAALNLVVRRRPFTTTFSICSSTWKAASKDASPLFRKPLLYRTVQVYRVCILSLTHDL